MVVATLGGLQFFSGAESVAGNTLTQSGRGSVTFGQKPFLNAHANAAPSTSFDGRGLSRNRYQAHAVSAQTLDLETRPQTKGQRFQVPDFLPVRGLVTMLSLAGFLVIASVGLTWIYWEMFFVLRSSCNQLCSAVLVEHPALLLYLLFA